MHASCLGFSEQLLQSSDLFHCMKQRWRVVRAGLPRICAAWRPILASILPE